ncbi:MAG: calcium/sodium antiporter [Thiohalocapsa sp.]
MMSEATGLAPMQDLLISSCVILLGLVGLIIGGDLLVRGASKLAAAARISPLVIGITVVSFGTSAPELAVTVQAAIAGSPELAVGNVVGSNIANVLLILGAAALIAPLAVQSRIVKVDLPMIFGAALAFWLMALDGVISWVDGAILFAALLVYLVWSIKQGSGEQEEVQQQFSDAAEQKSKQPKGGKTMRLAKQGLLLVGGLVILVISAQGMVAGSTEIARHFGVSDLVIGLTVVAIGTSLPELVASVVASWRGQGDIAVGNVVGSNLFNILAVLGIGAMVAPDGIPVPRDALYLDIPIMIAVTFACLPVFFTGCRINRAEGAVLLGYFIAYTTYVVMGATDASYTRSFEIAMLGFVIPITLLGIGYSVYQSMRMRRANSDC